MKVCQNVNRIKLCMETGRTVILLNLENLYESLYDALNQVSIRLVLIAERTTVYEKFPIPLISRLEKHFVVTSSVFSDWQNDVLKRLTIWVEKFSKCDDYDNSSKFKVEEAFIGYQKDTPAAVIFKATNIAVKSKNVDLVKVYSCPVFWGQFPLTT
ncbi:hypothetical protein EMCRGX_G017436 [Ephydatia muelleri]